MLSLSEAMLKTLLYEEGMGILGGSGSGTRWIPGVSSGLVTWEMPGSYSLLVSRVSTRRRITKGNNKIMLWQPILYIWLYWLCTNWRTTNMNWILSYIPRRLLQCNGQDTELPMSCMLNFVQYFSHCCLFVFWSCSSRCHNPIVLHSYHCSFQTTGKQHLLKYWRSMLATSAHLMMAYCCCAHLTILHHILNDCDVSTLLSNHFNKKGSADRDKMCSVGAYNCCCFVSVICRRCASDDLARNAKKQFSWVWQGIQVIFESMREIVCSILTCSSPKWS